MKRGQRGGFEGAIPLILIAVLAIFLAGRFGLIDMSSVPVVGQLFPSPQMKVAVIGHASQDMRNLLTSEDFRVAGVVYVGDIDQKVVYKNVLNSFDIVILQGDPVCDRTARKTVADKVKAGGRLVVVQDACTRVSDDRAAIGWDIGIGSLGDVMPVIIGGVTHEFEPFQTTPVDGKFKIIGVDHPMFNGVKNFQFHSTVTGITSLNPKGNGEPLAFIDASSLGKVTAPTLFAIVESKGFVGGKTMYFAFDPATVAQEGSGRNMFLNTLLYLRGAKG
ncbi:hypothetical protein HY995_04280 [Candidatus Micrarchaeota archaeon]|nr:hypothetical protein [Candidatus Micrarchaeota archaeon]MBI5177273.1 hypothetical protein [Candidatus Micrarchaeota archaeon]